MLCYLYLLERTQLVFWFWVKVIIFLLHLIKREVMQLDLYVYNQNIYLDIFFTGLYFIKPLDLCVF